MAKNLTIGGKPVSTDEDWYEIDAFGKRTGARHFGGVQGAAGPSGAPAASAGAAAGGGGATSPAAMAGITQAAGGNMSLEGGEFFDMPQAQAIRPGLGKRVMPSSAMPLAGMKVY